MKTLFRLLSAFISFSLLIACANMRAKPLKIPAPIESITPSQIAPGQSSWIAPTPTTALPGSAIIDLGFLSPALKMNTKRAAHTATLLADGRVLIAGGFRQEGTAEIPIKSAETFDPKTNSFTAAADLNEERTGHTATLLPNGQVLIAGGWGVNGRSSTAELFDPQTGKFYDAASLNSPRASMTATLLDSGQILIAGGDSARSTPQLNAEIYDPGTNTFTPSGRLNQGRSAHTATLLNDGRVLLSGGRSGSSNILAGAEIYNPKTGTFTPTGSMNRVRHKHAAVLLPDGNVLLIGGSDQNDWHGQYDSAEIYDTGTGLFTPTADLKSERFKLADAAVLLNKDYLLVGGGSRQIELFNTQNRQFTAGGELDNDYYFSVLTLLQDGRVLITGGYDSQIRPSAKAWLYTSPGQSPAGGLTSTDSTRVDPE